VATTDSSDAITEGSDATIGESQPVRLLLKPSGRPLAAWIGRESIEITRLPFIVGRKGEGEDGTSNDNIDLVLADEKPYQLSRQHFAIDTCNGELVIRDSGSYHGTTVNRQRIGNDRKTNMVPLHLGENSIIAGSPDSPYCFTLLIEAA
jgi:pSer/pThr/pTyr-binding forkhead associated (FHA) protein